MKQSVRWISNIQWGVLAIALCSVMFATSSCNSDDEDAELSYQTAENWQFSNKVTFSKTGNGNITKFLALMPIPQSNIYQTVENLTYNGGEVMTDNNYGNKALYVGTEDFPSTGLTLETLFDVHTNKVQIDVSKIKDIKPYDPNSEPYKRYLGDRGEYIVTSNPYIVRTGDELWRVSSNTLDYARRCYEFVATQFRYIHGSWRTLEQILKTGGGECGDFSTVVVNLLRYKGIPSRHNICLTLTGGYHVWVDFYLEGYGWIPLDATYKNSDPKGDYFGSYDGKCIIVQQDLGYDLGLEIQPTFLQTYYYHFSFEGGDCDINAKHTHFASHPL